MQALLFYISYLSHPSLSLSITGVFTLLQKNDTKSFYMLNVTKLGMWTGFSCMILNPTEPHYLGLLDKIQNNWKSLNFR